MSDFPPGYTAERSADKLTGLAGFRRAGPGDVRPPSSSSGLTDSIRLNRITNAVVAGVSKSKFPFESDVERDAWDRITVQVADIRAAGGEVRIPNESS